MKQEKPWDINDADWYTFRWKVYTMYLKARFWLMRLVNGADNDTTREKR